MEMLSSPPLLDEPNALELSQSPSIASSMHKDVSLSRQASVNSTTGSQFLSGAGIEWQDIRLAELVESNKLITIDYTKSVEEAFQTLVENGLTSVPVEEYTNDLNCLTFDYTDLNAYLLLVLNKIKAQGLLNTMNYDASYINEMIQRAQKGDQVPVSFVIRLNTKNPFIKLTEDDTISTVVEILGTGVHRVAITNENKLTGILSQRRLVKYLWENARRFPSMEPLFQSSIKSLNIGSANPISIFGDQPLIEALMKMHDLKMSSLAVVDRNYHLLGNISVTDVRLVSNTSKSDLLYKSCLHFISVILNSRGLENGKDSFPIFHITNQTSLGRALAKLVATKSHRLWIVRPEPSSPSTASSSANSSATPSANSSSQTSPVSSVPKQLHSHHSHHSHHLHHGKVVEDDLNSHHTGTLVGVLSLTDILFLYARTLGKSHVQPSIARKQRRRSSSGQASLHTNSSFEMFRKSIVDGNSNATCSNSSGGGNSGNR